MKHSQTTILAAIVALGFSAAVTQFVLMRELFAVLGGNEIVVGVVLGNWLLLTGLGAWMGRLTRRVGRPETAMAFALVFAALAAVGAISAVRTLWSMVFVRGAMAGVFEIVTGSFVTLLPYCLASGFLLTAACRAMEVASGISTPRENDKTLGRIYLADAAGTVIGGLAFTFVMVHNLGHFACLYLAGGLCILASIALCIAHRRRICLAATSLAAAAYIVMAICGNMEKLTTDVQNAGFEVAFAGNSPYGRVVVTRSAGQYNFIHNGVPQFSTHDVAAAEQMVHPAMSQRPHARRVLVIGGGLSGAAGEVLKYPSARVDYVELDPLVLLVASKFVPETLNDPRIRIIPGDGRDVVRSSAEKYDVIIAAVPEPSTFQANRYYTQEFFRQVKRILADDGVLCLPLGEYENVLTPSARAMLATAGATLRNVFANVQVVPTGKILLLASDGVLGRDLAASIALAGVPVQLLTPGYLSGMLTPGRTTELNRVAAQIAPVDTDFSPSLCYYHLQHWLSRFQAGKLLPLLAVPGGLLLAYLLYIRRTGMAIFAAGFTASSLEIVLLLGFQVLYGSVYHKLSLLVTLFMAGLAAGAIVVNRFLARCSRQTLCLLELATSLYACLLVPAMQYLGHADSAGMSAGTGHAAFSLLAALLGVLAGSQFPLAGKLEMDLASTSAGRLYLADMVGSCLGALLASTLIIPLWGVTAACLVTAGVNVLAGLVILPAPRTRTP